MYVIKVDIFCTLFFLSCFFSPLLGVYQAEDPVSGLHYQSDLVASYLLRPEEAGLSAQPSAATTRTLCNFNLSGGRGGRNVTG